MTLTMGVEVGWTAAQWPFVIPPDLTIEATAAPPEVLRMLLIVAGAGSVLLVPSFAYLYRVFALDPLRSPPEQG